MLWAVYTVYTAYLWFFVLGTLCTRQTYRGPEKFFFSSFGKFERQVVTLLVLVDTPRQKDEN